MSALSQRCKAVLVVDDDADVREGLLDAIESAGRKAFAAADGAEALAKLDSRQLPRPCLLILDWRMSPMDGKELLARLKARDDFPDLPVIVTSGDSHVPPETGAPGVRGILRKPFGLDELLTFLDAHC